MAGQLHGSQDLIVCGKAGADTEAHVVQEGRQEVETQVQEAVILF